MNSPGRPGSCLPGLPQIRTCPIKAYGSSGRGLACPVLPVVVPETVDRGPKPSHCCPPTVPRPGTPFPPPGSRGTSSPTSTVLWSAPNPQRPTRRPSFPSRDGDHSLRLFSFLRPSPTPAWGRGFLGLATTQQATLREMATLGPPKFMGNPVVPAPCSWTPARPTYQVTTVGRRGPTHILPRRLSTRGNFGARSHGIGTGCLRFAVRFTPPHARLASGCPARLYQAGLVTRRVPTKGFRDVSHRFLLSHASWRSEWPLVPPQQL